MAAAAASVTAGMSSPQAIATDRHSRGRMRWPPGNTACRKACASSGGPERDSARASAASNAASIRLPEPMVPSPGLR
jgi:hypothetical protein